MATTKCDVCGSVFSMNSPTHVYCSPGCRDKAADDRRAALEELKNGTCPVCDIKFHKQRVSSTYCSLRCRKIGVNFQVGNVDGIRKGARTKLANQKPTGPGLQGWEHQNNVGYFERQKRRNRKS